MKIIGITGGIGSGKSKVVGFLEKNGAKVIDADKIAREVVKKGEKALEEIVSCFGRDILNYNGELDRKKLADIVFTDLQKLEELNRITHKYIIDKILEIVGESEIEGYSILAIEAAIPTERGFIDIANEVWVVSAKEDIRIKRIMQRNSFNYDEAKNRIDSQNKDEDYFKIADRIIYNNDDVKKLEEEINSILFNLK